MTCLVTGATGFVGAAVTRHLLANGFTVRAFCRPNSDRRNLDGLEITIAEGDLITGKGIDAALQGCRYLFHVAADYRLWVPDPGPMYRCNVDGTRSLMAAALRCGIERVVYTSSVATLGIDPNGPADETTPVTLADMVGHYKRSKYLAERDVVQCVREQGLPAVVVHPSTPIGPGDLRPTPTGRIVQDAARGRIPAFVDTGLNVVHVDDVAAGHLLALQRGRAGEGYILGGTDLTLAEILALVAGRCGRRPPKVQLPRGLLWPVAVTGEVWGRLTGARPLVTRDELRMSAKRMYFASDKALRELGYRYRAPEEAIDDALGWFKHHGYV